MTFNPSIPRSTDRPSTSQGQILTNFSQTKTVFGQDHVEFDNSTASDRGKHKKNTFVQQSGDQVTAANEMAQYVKDVGGAAELFLRRESNGTVLQQSNLTVTSAANGGSAGGTINFFDTSWNFRFLMGQTNAFSGTGTVVFPTPFTTVFAFLATANDGNVQRISAQSSATTLTLHTESSVSVSYFVIGRL